MTTGAQARIQDLDAGGRASAAARPQAVTLYLALFLALLAFFLFLTSISSFDPARAVSVIDSIEARFAEAVEPQSGPERLTPHFAGPAGERIVADAGFTSTVSEIFADFEGQQTNAADTDGVVWHGVRLNPAALFLRDTAALSADGSKALNAAAAAMAVEVQGDGTRTRRIDIAVGGNTDLALRRAVALASVITAVNGPAAVCLRTMPDSATVPGSVEFVFYTVLSHDSSVQGGRS